MILCHVLYINTFLFLSTTTTYLLTGKTSLETVFEKQMSCFDKAQLMKYQHI